LQTVYISIKTVDSLRVSDIVAILGTLPPSQDIKPRPQGPLAIRFLRRLTHAYSFPGIEHRQSVIRAQVSITP